MNRSYNVLTGLPKRNKFIFRIFYSLLARKMTEGLSVDFDEQRWKYGLDSHWRLLAIPFLLSGWSAAFWGLWEIHRYQCSHCLKITLTSFFSDTEEKLQIIFLLQSSFLQFFPGYKVISFVNNLIRKCSQRASSFVVLCCFKVSKEHFVARTLPSISEKSHA